MHEESITAIAQHPWLLQLCYDIFDFLFISVFAPQQLTLIQILNCEILNILQISKSRQRISYSSAPQPKMFQARFQECSHFRRIIDSIKQLVKNVNIDVTPKGISIQAMDSCHIALVSLQLKEKAFSHYNCQKPLTLGLAIENVAKILKIAGSDDSLTLSCEEEPSELKFKFQSKRAEKISEFNLSLITIDSQGMGIPQTQFTSICTMPSGEFSRICKQFVNLSESIKIETTKQNIKFSITGQIGTGSAILSQLNSGNQNDSVTLDVDEPVSLSFASRYLNLFSRAACLSGQVQLNMSNETPLMVVYKIMNGMGDIKYYLAPKITEEE